MHKFANKSKKRNKGKHHPYLWIPVGICIVVASLFLFGVLPGDKIAHDASTAAPILSASPSPAPANAQPNVSEPAPLAQETPAQDIAQDVVQSGAQDKAQESAKPKNAPNTRYEVSVSLYEELSRVSGGVRVYYENVTEDTLYELVFHLHPNAFFSPDSPGAAAEAAAYKKGFSKGETLISSVSINRELSYFTISDDGLLLHVPFLKELMPGESIEVYIEFYVRVPTLSARFGISPLGYQLGNFLPILAVYQDGAFVTKGYQDLGDPFYSEVAEYSVSFQYPLEYTLACTGNIIDVEERSGYKRATVHAKRAREFALMLTKGMKQAQAQHMGILILSYAKSEAQAKSALEEAQSALSMLIDHIGPYPYDTLTIAQADLHNASGMEYPNFIMVDQSLYASREAQSFKLTIAHELAHQWFYALVGSDQIQSPWLDEALCTYLSMLALEENSPAFEAYFARISEFAAQGGRVDGALYEYETQGEYMNAVYNKGALLFHTLRKNIGDASFFSALKLYAQQNAYGVAVREDLIHAFEQSAGEPLFAYFPG